MLYFLIILLTIGVSKSALCVGTYNCHPSVSVSYNYVVCESGECRCLYELGFNGTATTTDKCRCDSPYKVEWENSVPYCIKLSDAVLYKNNKAQEKKQMDSVSLIFKSLVYPRPVTIMAALYNGTETPESLLFELNCKSRVDPAGEFVGRDFQVEYFYAKVFRPNSIIVQTVIKQLYSSGNMVYIKVDFLFNTTGPNNTYTLLNLTETGTFTFNTSSGMISSYYITILNAGTALDDQFPDTPDNRFLICYIILNVAGCNSTHDPLGYYTDISDCLDYHTHIPWGSFNDFYMAGGNTSLCHLDHGDLAIGRPFIHCPHAGKTGAGYCTKKPYPTFYNVDYK